MLTPSADRRAAKFGADPAQRATAAARGSRKGIATPERRFFPVATNSKAMPRAPRPRRWHGPRPRWPHHPLERLRLLATAALAWEMALCKRNRNCCCCCCHCSPFCCCPPLSSFIAVNAITTLELQPLLLSLLHYLPNCNGVRRCVRERDGHRMADTVLVAHRRQCNAGIRKAHEQHAVLAFPQHGHVARLRRLGILPSVALPR